MDTAAREQIESTIKANRIVLFMKGNKLFPQCGFSARVLGTLKELGEPFEAVNVLSDPAIRQGIKDFSEWPTIPQLYVDGQFVGGCDIVMDLHDRGELAKLVAPKDA